MSCSTTLLKASVTVIGERLPGRWHDRSPSGSPLCSLTWRRSCRQCGNGLHLVVVSYDCAFQKECRSRREPLFPGFGEIGNIVDHDGKCVEADSASPTGAPIRML